MRAFLAAPHYIGSGKSEDRNARPLEDAVAPSIIARLIDRPLMELMTVSFNRYNGPTLVTAGNKYREVYVADCIATSSHGPHRLIQIVSDDKINIVGGKVIIACTGAVGLSQRFHGIVNEAWATKAFQKPIAQCLQDITRATLQNFEYSGVPRTQQGGLGFGSLMAAPIGGAAELIEFGTLDFQPEIKKDRLHFVAMGSGQVLADPFLAFVSRVLWAGRPPDVQMGAFGLYWVLSHTIQYAPGGVGHPIKIAVLKKEKGDWVARSVEGDDLQEPEQHVAGIEKRIGEYPKAVVEMDTATPLPEPPQTPKGDK